MLIKIDRRGEVVGSETVWQRMRLQVPWGAKPAYVDAELKKGVRAWMQEYLGRGYRLVDGHVWPEYYPEPAKDRRGNLWQRIRVYALFEVPKTIQYLEVPDDTARKLLSEHPDRYKIPSRV